MDHKTNSRKIKMMNFMKKDKMWNVVWDRVKGYENRT